MALVRATEKRVGAEILVVGFARTKSARSEKRSFEIESGDMAIDKSGLIDALADMGATGDPDEVIKLPASGYKLLVLTGLGDKSSSGIYSHERLRRASGAAARSLHGQALCAVLHHQARGRRGAEFRGGEASEIRNGLIFGH